MSPRARVTLTGAVDSRTGAEVDVRRGRGPRVLFLPHSADCDECRAYAAGLEARSEEISEWGGRTSIVLGAAADAAADAFPARMQLLRDVTTTAGVKPAAVIIADEWGEVQFSIEAVADHALPDMTEVVEWVRFISIHCPECEQPEGEWRSVG